MKKIFISLLLLFTFTLAINTQDVHGAYDYRFDIEGREIKYIHGLEHRAVNGKMHLNGDISNQYYNYLTMGMNGANNHFIVSVDGYNNYTFGMKGMQIMIEDFENDNPSLEVLAGFSGDFYLINQNGEAINTYVKDYEVIIPGAAHSKVFVTDENGKNSFRNVNIQGYEIVVLNEFKELKGKFLVNGNNRGRYNDTENVIILNNYNGAEIIDEDSMFFEMVQSKNNYYADPESAHFYNFAKGTYVENGLNINKKIQIISKDIKAIIAPGDTVLYQARIEGFDDVRYGASTYASHLLVDKGEVKIVDFGEYPSARHPRTAIGIKEDGEVFVVVVDGRNRMVPKHGVSFTELAHIMHQHGAYEAFNLDGGGSSTLMLRNNVAEGTVLERFDVLNELSDGRLRSLSNGFLLVRGPMPDKRVIVETPDTRPIFAKVNNVFVDENMVLNFNEVSGATSYEVSVNGKIYETANNYLPLINLSVGNNIILVRAKGTSEYKTSEFSSSINYRTYSNPVQSLIDLLYRTM